MSDHDQPPTTQPVSCALHHVPPSVCGCDPVIAAGDLEAAAQELYDTDPAGRVRITLWPQVSHSVREAVIGRAAAVVAAYHGVPAVLP